MLSSNLSNPIVLAPSDLDYAPMKCSRCFYLSKIQKIKIQNFPPPVFSNFDVVQQAYFKDKNTSDLTDKLPSGRIMKKEEIPGRIVSSTLKDNKGREFILGGRPDIVVEFENKNYGIIDFKTTNLKEDKSESYRYQLEAYKQIFSNPGSTKTASTPKLSPITHMGVLQFFPKDIFKHETDNCGLNLVMQYSKLEPNERLFYNRITYILDILTSNEQPEYNDQCTDCDFVKKQINL